MDVLLCRPPSRTLPFIYEDLGLEVVAGSLRDAGIACRIDDGIQDPCSPDDYVERLASAPERVVGLTLHSELVADRHLDLLARLKRRCPDKLVIVGGHPAAAIDAAVAGAVGLALISFNSAMVTARGFAVKNRYDLDANRDFIALGVADIGAGILQGFAVSGADSRTAVNDSIGGKSQVTGLVAAAVLAQPRSGAIQECHHARLSASRPARCAAVRGARSGGDPSANRLFSGAKS